MFKNIKIMLVAMGCIALFATACKKYDADTYEFTNQEKNYIRFSVKSVTVNADVAVDSLDQPILDSLDMPYYIYEPTDVGVETRMAFTEDIIYTYVISLEGMAPVTKTGVLTRGTTTSKISLDYPESEFPNNVDVLTGTLELVKAEGANYGDLRLGYPAVGERTKVSLVINRPRDL